MQEDETRGNYGFKEQSLSRRLVEACNLDLNANISAKKAVNWRRGSGKSAGDFPAAMEEVENEPCMMTESDKPKCPYVLVFHWSDDPLPHKL